MAKDHGDPFPSDVSDEPPGDPTEGFVEIDYDVLAFDGKKRKAIENREFYPDPQTEDPEPEQREHWSGVITAELNPKNAYPRLYSVLCDDGRHVEAFAWQVLEFEEYKPGHDVVVQRVYTHPNVYNITGKARPKELQVLQLKIGTADGGLCSGAAMIVPFDEIELRLPPDDTSDQFTDALGDNIKLKFVDKGIESAFNEETLCTISFSVGLRLQTPKDGLNDVYVTQGCWEPDTYQKLLGFDAWKSPLLWFNQQNGFRVEYDPADCSIAIMLASTCKDSVLNQQKKDEAAFFTDSPKFGGNVSVGTVKPGWLKFGTGASTNLWIKDSGGELKFQFPMGPPEHNGAVFIAEAVNVGDKCVRGGWLGPGVSGDVTFQTNQLDHYNTVTIYGYTISIPVYKTCTLSIDRGLVLRGCDLQENTQTGGVQCYSPDPCEDKPCE